MTPYVIKTCRFVAGSSPRCWVEVWLGDTPITKSNPREGYGFGPEHLARTEAMNRAAAAQLNAGKAPIVEFESGFDRIHPQTHRSHGTPR